MRIFVTGANGFIGSYFVEDILDHGHEVAVLLREPDAAWRLGRSIDRTYVIKGSLDDVAQFREPLSLFRPEAVIHFGWWGVAKTYRNDSRQARNIVATVELATLSGELGVSVFVGAGSQAEYGPYARAIREDDPPHPTTLYGKAKLAAGLMAEQICAERNMRFAWLRIFSTYGPKDEETWLIPTVIRTLRSRTRVSLTPGNQRWGWLHVRDAAAAFRFVILQGKAAGTFNVGSPEAPPLQETVRALRDLVDPSAELGFGDVPYGPDQVMILKADVARLTAIGWKPQMSLMTGLREMVAWYDSR